MKPLIICLLLCSFSLAKNSQQEEIVEAMRHSWNGYKTFAFGHDILRPISQSYEEWFGLRLTMIDSLDTLFLMNLTEELAQAKFYLKQPWRIQVHCEANVFEIMIRVVGGYLGMYALTRDFFYFHEAVSMADQLMPAFDQTILPFSSMDLINKVPRKSPGSVVSTAEATTVQMELNYLTRLTGNQIYKFRGDSIMKHFKSLESLDGLVPIYLNQDSGQFSSKEIRLGSRGDSFYEYLLKTYIQQGQQDLSLLEWFKETVAGMEKHLLRRTRVGNFLFVGELLQGNESASIHPKMDHLVCFLPGTLALSVTMGKSIGMIPPLTFEQRRILDIAQDLMKTCYEMYASTATGLSPEIVFFDELNDPPITSKPADRHNLLRPETVESLFVLYRITKDAKYRDWGWNIFKSWQKHARVDSGGYCCIQDVSQIPVTCIDKMESFWLSETLKYLYLLFDDQGLMELDRWVFNTEAHAFPIF